MERYKLEPITNVKKEVISDEEVYPALKGDIDDPTQKENISDPTQKEDIGDPTQSKEQVVEKVKDDKLEVMEEEMEEVPKRVEYFCGFGKCRPRWLQVFRNVYFISFLICADNLIEGAVSTGENKI